MTARNFEGATFSMHNGRAALVLTVLIALVTVATLLVFESAAAELSEPGKALSVSATDETQGTCPANMISYWRLDESTGTVFADSIQGLDASCSGDACPSFATGTVNGALTFDGVDDGLTAPDAPQYEWGTDDSFSVELWAKTPECDDSVFFGKHSFDASWWLGCSFDGDYPAFSLRDNAMSEEVRITGTTSINDGNWHHIVGLRDGQTGENRLYVDGVLEASTTHDYAEDFNNDNQLTFGFHHNKFHVEATIDEIAVYSTALTADEIEAHYQYGLQGLDYCNEPPQAEDGSHVTTPDTALSISLAYNDPDGPGPYAFTILDTPDHGVLSGSGDSRTYTPNTGYTGSDSFTWQVNDGLDDSNVATVHLLVTEDGSNDAPVASSQAVETERNTPLSIDLEYEDPDGGPGPYTVTIVDGPDHGALSGSGNSRTYTPDTDYAGSDSFTWQVNDGLDDSNVVTVTVTVNNEPPLAESNIYQTTSDTAVDIQLHYLDPDGLPGPYTVTIVDGPDHGALSGSDDSRTYTPDAGYTGSDSFTWRVNDGLDDSNVATISIEISDETPVNDPPVAHTDTYQTLPGVSVLITPSFTDPDNGPGPYTLVIESQPQHGTLSGTGLNRTYTPEDNFSGVDSFEWRVNDGVDDSNVAEIVITVFEETHVLHLPLTPRE